MGGCGKVGTAVDLALKGSGINSFVLDKDGEYKPKVGLLYKFMHVCIPWSRDFHRDVRMEMKRYDPKFVVVHSTVPVGTTRRLGYNAAHSPVRGQHNNLDNSIKKFVKYVAGVTPRTTNAVAEHLSECGIAVKKWSKPEETEIMKQLCLSRLLNDLSFYEVAHKICDENGVPPSRLFDWTWTYNDGYRGSIYTRPELTFPYGKAGGTCVRPVSEMLYKHTKHPWLKRNLDLFRGSGVAK
jgi:UDP-N-acetyl-D-mannosaminuronate dehydrogenase